MGVTEADNRACQGHSALFLAAASNRTEVVGILIEAGADINLQTNDVSSAVWVYQRLMVALCVQGNSALIRAALNRLIEVMGILIEGKADINLQNNVVSSADWCIRG